MKHLTCNKGFSLLEVIIAIFVITIGITGAVNLINFGISSATVSKSQIIATNIAQEGMEIVRGVRDSNWIEDVNWNDGLGAGDYRAQYNSRDLLTFSDIPLRIDSSGYYQYDTGIDSLYYRKITINTISAIEIEVTSEVSWSERGRSHAVSAKGRLYDWK